jgi:hypothetical protein
MSLRPIVTTLALVVAVVSRGHAETTVSFERQASEVRVLLDGILFTAFRHGGVEKPGLYPLLAPGGAHVTRGFPMAPRPGEAHDHPHHTSQWFAHGDVNGVDFWSGRDGARIVIADEPRLDVDAGTVRATLEWRDGEGRPVCTERRTMRFGGAEGVRFVDFDVSLVATHGPPTLRLKGDVAKGSSLSSAGHRDGQCWGKRAAWVEYRGPVDENDIGVAIFDHPENPRHPTWWHARDYGLFAANPFGVHDFEGKPRGAGDLQLAAGESLRFRYRIVIHAGRWDKTRLDAAHAAWAAR